jgi:NADH dehydrogenase
VCGILTWRIFVYRALKAKGVQVRYNTAVRRVHEDGVDIHDPFSGASETIPADLVLLTAGTEQTGLIQHTALRKDAFGRVVTNRSLQSVDVPYVFALGDCSAVEGDANPCTAQVAMQQAPVVAQNVLAYLDQAQSRAAGDSAGTATEARVGDSSAMKQFRFFSLGEMLSLGDTNASIVSLGGWVTLSGPIAALGRRAVYGVRMPTLTQGLTALVSAGAVTSGKLLSSMFQK